jgi:hypothetical protein
MNIWANPVTCIISCPWAKPPSHRYSMRVRITTTKTLFLCLFNNDLWIAQLLSWTNIENNKNRVNLLLVLTDRIRIATCHHEDGKANSTSLPKGRKAVALKVRCKIGSRLTYDTPLSTFQCNNRGHRYGTHPTRKSLSVTNITRISAPNTKSNMINERRQMVAFPCWVTLQELCSQITSGFRVICSCRFNIGYRFYCESLTIQNLFHVLCLYNKYIHGSETLTKTYSSILFQCLIYTHLFFIIVLQN